MLPTLLDTDVLSEVLKQRDDNVLQAARVYLDEWRRFTFSVLTRYEILRGLRAKGAVRQELAFDALCRLSQVLPLTEPIAVRAAAIYADLQLRGELISDADILIAATALEHRLAIATGNIAHFERIPSPVCKWSTGASHPSCSAMANARRSQTNQEAEGTAILPPRCILNERGNTWALKRAQFPAVLAIALDAFLPMADLPRLATQAPSVFRL